MQGTAQRSQETSPGGDETITRTARVQIDPQHLFLTSYHHHLFWRWSSHVLSDYFQASLPSRASACVSSSPASVSSCPSAGQATEEGSKTFLPPGPISCSSCCCPLP